MRLSKPHRHQQAVLAERAHGLGLAPTVSEARRWQELSGNKLGVTFRRQVPVGHRYIVDFLAPALKLVVEVDGSAHEHRGAADARRDERLGRLGYRVIRVEAREVMGAPATVVERIAGAIAALR